MELCQGETQRNRMDIHRWIMVVGSSGTGLIKTERMHVKNILCHLLHPDTAC